MINITLLWMFLIPAVLSVASFFILRKTTKYKLASSSIEAIAFSGIAFFISAIILVISFYVSKGFKTQDTEIWNGEVTNKTRIHGTYVESYDCNCRTVTTTSGTGANRTTSSRQECDTCYRDHFTVKWDCHSNIGSVNIKSLDWTNKRVYDEPDPERYSIIKIGDPFALSKSYTNYIKAVPESLFRPASNDLKTRYANQIPAYPIEIYDFYKVNRILPIGINLNVSEWNDKLSIALKKLGPVKQANAVIVITKNPDQNFIYALQDAWVGGKKNDVIVVIGAPDFPKKATWVRILAFSDHDIFKVKLRDDILALEELNADNVINLISKNTMESFKRKSMKDFKYLENEIDPPDWVLITSSVVVLFVYLGFWFYFFNANSSGFKRRF